MAKPTILTLIPNPIDALSFYRAMGPFRRMKNEFNFVNENNYTWANVSQADILFAERPYRKEHLEIVKMAKKWGTPVVMDFDDWLFDLKTDNPAWKTYNSNQEVKKVIEEIHHYADICFVATEHLKKLYEEKNKKTKFIVVPNAYDKELFSYRTPKPERKKILLWRGSDTHVQDCLSVRAGFEKLMEKHTDWVFVFMHQYPWFFSKAYPNMSYAPGLAIYDYFEYIYNLEPAIMVHPLSDCDFNRAKSMACFLEASHAGATFVGPSFEEFSRPGISQYKADDSESFFNVIDSLITNPQRIVDNAAIAYEYTTSALELGAVNKLRSDAFRDLI